MACADFAVGPEDAEKCEITGLESFSHRRSAIPSKWLRCSPLTRRLTNGVSDAIQSLGGGSVRRMRLLDRGGRAVWLQRVVGAPARPATRGDGLAGAADA